jgi:hypothetical protein
MNLLGQRFNEIDPHMDSATVSNPDLSNVDRNLAHELCSYVELPLTVVLILILLLWVAIGLLVPANC